ncbi:MULTISPECIES: hypothetical protein [unclassified Streptomyces]|uniref:hypothetical protein n=1 Tax=unclassified Streptomyces TaxID=2593676 RepID=UPI002E2CCC9D|nr:hypothetical protein [Streptomyces sp. NBC_01429]
MIALAVGLVLGGGGVGAAWALSGGGEEPGARADAVAACAALDGFDESKYMTKGPAGEVASHRWGAAYSLSRAAAAGDAAYKPLATTLQEATDRIMMTFKVDAEVKAGIGKARDLCADL